jgi:hypothetical protein
MNINECTHVFYVPGELNVIDCAWQPDGVNWQTAINATPMAEVIERYPTAQLMTWDEVIPLIQEGSYAKYKSAPVEITEDRWDEMLNVLPPMKWRSGRGAESFMISEALTLDLRSIFCRIGDRYFEMTDKQSLTHEQIAEMCLPLLATPA